MTPTELPVDVFLTLHDLSFHESLDRAKRKLEALEQQIEKARKAVVVFVPKEKLSPLLRRVIERQFREAVAAGEPFVFEIPGDLVVITQAPEIQIDPPYVTLDLDTS